MVGLSAAAQRVLLSVVMLLVKLILILLLGFIVISLFSGLYFLVKDKGQTRRTVNALSIRIGLSIVAIVIVMIAGGTGLISFKPNPLSARPPPAADESESGETAGSRSPDNAAPSGDTAE